jgi:hypothetical protein
MRELNFFLKDCASVRISAGCAGFPETNRTFFVTSGFAVV